MHCNLTLQVKWLEIISCSISLSESFLVHVSFDPEKLVSKIKKKKILLDNSDF